MSDNTRINLGTTGPLMVTRELTHAGDTSHMSGMWLAGMSGTEGSYTIAAINGDATNGLDVDVTRVPTDPFGTNADSASATGSISAKLRYIANTGIPITGTVTVGSHAVTDGSGSLTVDAPVGTPVFVRLSDGSSAITTLPVSLASVPSHAVTNAGTFAVQVDGAALTSLQLIDDTVFTDDATFTAATSKVLGIGAKFDASSVDSVDEDDIGIMRMSANRNLFVNIRDSAGNERGLNIDASGFLTANINGTVTVGSHAVTDGGGTLTVDAPVGTPVFVRLSDGSSAISTLPVSLASVPSHAVTNAGTFAVQVDGAALTSLQLLDDVVIADDAAFTPASTKVLMVGAQLDNTSPDSVDEGDAGALRMSANRNLFVNIRDAAGNERGLNVDASGNIAVTQSGTWNVGTVTTLTTVSTVSAVTAVGTITPGTAATSLGKAEDAAHTTGDVGVMALAVRSDTATATGANGDYVPLLTDSTGRLHANVSNTVATSLSNSAGSPVYVQLSDGVDPITSIEFSGSVDVGTVTGGNLPCEIADMTYNGGTMPVVDNQLGPIASNLESIDSAINASLTVNTHAVTQSGTWNIAAITTSVTPGTSAAHLGKAEDAAHTTGDVGVMGLAVRKDSATALSGTDGDYTPLITDSTGRLWCVVSNTVGVSGSVVASQSGTWNIGTVTPGSGATNLGKAEDAAHASDDIGVMALAVRKNTAASTSGTDGDYQPLITNTTGHLWVDASGQTLTVSSHAVTNAGTFAVQVDGAALTSLQLIDDVVIADDAAFTPATTKVLMVGFQADESSTDSVNEGDAGAARITLDRKIIVNDQPHTAGGLSAAFATVSDASVQTCKGSTGTLYGIRITNMGGNACALKLYNHASPSVGSTTPLDVVPIPADSVNGDWLVLNVQIPKGLAFGTAIKWAVTNAVDNGDTDDPGNSVHVSLSYF